VKDRPLGPFRSMSNASWPIKNPSKTLDEQRNGLGKDGVAPGHKSAQPALNGRRENRTTSAPRLTNWKIYSYLEGLGDKLGFMASEGDQVGGPKGEENQHGVILPENLQCLVVN